MRLAMLVVASDASAVLTVAPLAQTMIAMPIPAGSTSTQLIHASSYPLLVSLPWWAIADKGVDVTVYQVLRTQ